MAFFSVFLFKLKQKIMFLFIFQSIRRVFDDYYCQKEHEQISLKKCDLFVFGSSTRGSKTKANNFKLNLSNFHATIYDVKSVKSRFMAFHFFNPLQFSRNIPDTSIQPLCRLSCRQFVQFFQNIFEIYGTYLTVDTNIIHVGTKKTQRAKVCRRRNHLGHTCVRPNTTKNAPLLHFNFVNVSFFSFIAD